MFPLHEPGPEHHSGRQPDLPLVLIDHWAQLAVDRPWRYAATGAIGIGGANLGLRMLLNDVSLARNTGMAILYAVGFSVFAWLYTAQLTRPRRQHRPRPVTNPAVPKHSCAARWRTRVPWPPRPRPAVAPVWAALAMPTTWGAIGQIGRTTTNSNRAPGRRLVLAAVAVTAVTVAPRVAAVAN